MMELGQWLTFIDDLLNISYSSKELFNLTKPSEEDQYIIPYRWRNKGMNILNHFLHSLVQLVVELGFESSLDAMPEREISARHFEMWSSGWKGHMHKYSAYIVLKIDEEYLAICQWVEMIVVQSDYTSADRTLPGLSDEGR